MDRSTVRSRPGAVAAGDNCRELRHGVIVVLTRRCLGAKHRDRPRRSVFIWVITKLSVSENGVGEENWQLVTVVMGFATRS